MKRRFAEEQKAFALRRVPATTVKVQYVWGQPGTGRARPLGFTARDFGRYIDAPVLRWRDETDDGDFLDANETLYYCQDANFDTTALVNTSGTVVERYVSLFEGWRWGVRS